MQFWARRPSMTDSSLGFWGLDAAHDLLAVLALPLVCRERAVKLVQVQYLDDLWTDDEIKGGIVLQNGYRNLCILIGSSLRPCHMNLW